MPRLSPNDPLPDKTKMIQLVDMEYHQGHPYGMTEDEIGEHCFMKLPMDFPGWIRFIRRVDKTKHGPKSVSMDTLATTLQISTINEMDLFIKFDRVKRRLVISYREKDGDPIIIGRFDESVTPTRKHKT